MSPAEPRDSTTFEVREALDQSGCPVCGLALRSVGRWLTSVAYDQVNDITLRTELRAARGLCNVHAHRWLREVRSVLGTAIVYQDLLRASLRELAEVTVERGPVWRALLGTPAADVGECPACRVQTQAEERYLTALLATAAADAHVLDGAEGTCLKHARAAQRRGGPGAERVVQQTQAAVERLLEELSEVIRKEDYRFRDEPRTDAERTATSRAITRAAGTDGLVDAPVQRDL
jgi:hypothetical protein